MAEDDIAWRHPETARRPEPAEAYAGPPALTSPDPQWRPQIEDPVPAPRRLPHLDHDAIDLEEQRAAWITYAVGLTALAVLIVLALTRVS